MKVLHIVTRIDSGGISSFYITIINILINKKSVLT